MAEAFSWKCPYCNHDAIIQYVSRESHGFRAGKHGPHILTSGVIVCPNNKCGEYTLRCVLQEAKNDARGNYTAIGPFLQDWLLVPASNCKVFPNYIPIQILADYREACAIRDLSPKASATLSRRCLQGIIRDFWGVKKGKLWEEIKGIEDKVDPVTWSAIEAVRTIGNIGAHMEKDIDLIIDVDPGEAQLLLGLIETLIEEWYVHRHEREERMAALKAAAEEKKAKKNGEGV